MKIIADAALRYAERGIPVFPVKGKKPLTEHGLKDASSDANIIRSWWSRWPDANVAIRTGIASGLFALDVDPQHDGHRSLEALEHTFGPLPSTLESRTGSGGRHLFFALLDGQTIRNSAGKLGPGLDVRGENGYLVVPPSLHPHTGCPYTWSNKTKPVLAPAWLIERLVEVVHDSCKAHPDAFIPSGQRNDTLTRLAGAMRRRGCTSEVIEAALLAENSRRCQPPLLQREVRNIVCSVGRYAPAPHVPQPKKSGFELTPLGDLLKEPEEKVSWLLADKLPAGGISVMSAKPKVGKSTLARCLAVAVGKGEPFLGGVTQRPARSFTWLSRRSVRKCDGISLTLEPRVTSRSTCTARQPRRTRCQRFTD
jgi:hypothetical protein